MRSTLVLLHRWAGLTTAVFLFITGLTGAVISWDHELDEWLNGHLLDANTPGQPIPMFELIEQAEARHPHMQVLYTPLTPEPGHSVSFYVQPRLNPATGERYELGFNQLFVDPVSGAELGTRQWGAVWPLSSETFVSFLYKLHYSLHLPEMWGIDEWGIWLLGGIALIWTLDCFFGIALTWPKFSTQRGDTSAVKTRNWFGNWGKRFGIRWNGGRYKLNFDLHQAVSLWTWGLLLIIAFTAFSLNLKREVFMPVLSAISDVTPTPYDVHPFIALADVKQPNLTMQQAIETATERARELGWDEPAGAVYYARQFGFYDVKLFFPDNDHGTAGAGHKELYVDAYSGEILGQRIPWQGSVADLFVQAQFPLHSGRILGLPGRILISAMGLVVAMLSVTGVIIWWRKRKARKATAAKQQQKSAQPLAV
ncbi:PepSY-associated TM helix domain-containing protein [Oceanobacter mangrovi]|uniref:PepSY-associated TM helix domain-containing protein n=1 Tax=Oceanobacter mangrovi TaxID=2862510 RepID=UPI001C8E5221|nr:PepSY-associated TM helix domain-containing protein [Oceanobacter mangrovi]